MVLDGVSLEDRVVRALAAVVGRPLRQKLEQALFFSAEIVALTRGERVEVLAALDRLPWEFEEIRNFSWPVTGGAGAAWRSRIPRPSRGLARATIVIGAWPNAARGALAKGCHETGGLRMLFHIKQTHAPHDCPYGKGGSRSLFDGESKDVKIHGYWLAFPQHTTY